jgi:hypothetical protein
MSKLVKTGLTFAAGGLLIHLSHGWGKPVDLFCTPPALPAFGAGDEAPSAPPLASGHIGNPYDERVHRCGHGRGTLRPAETFRKHQ